MRINHNLSALNTYSRLNSANSAKSKSLEKLSSGQRINRAGDDAAGLAISEKMRSQIRGLNQASRNSQDGISMIQTAEGALNESESILQRMRELAVQSANDTNTEQDRGEIQKEINQLSSEINRIAGTTEFNKQVLLNGDSSETTVNGATIETERVGKNVQQSVFEVEFTTLTNGCTHCLTITCNDGGGVICVNATVCYCGSISNGVAALATELKTCAELACQWDVEARGNKLIFTSRCAVTSTTSTTNINACTKIICSGGCDSSAICTSVQTQERVCAAKQINYMTITEDLLKEGTMITIGEKSAVFYNSACGNYEDANDVIQSLSLDTTVCVVDLFCTNSDTIDEVLTCLDGLLDCGTNEVVADTTNNRLCVITGTAGSQYNKYSDIKITGLAGTTATSGNGKSLQIGANADQTFDIYFADMTGKGIDIASDSSTGSLETSEGKTAYYNSSAAVTDMDGENTEYALDVTTAEKATAAVSALDDAIASVSAERSKLGAYQNRLEHTIANLNTSSENLTSAESRIRDVDMAKEMMEFTKNNILSQAATSMLSQANQSTQGVLSLLR